MVGGSSGKVEWQREGDVLRGIALLMERQKGRKRRGG